MRKKLEWEYADSEVSEAKIKEIGLKFNLQFPQD
jgi:hypothetical protein